MTIESLEQFLEALAKEESEGNGGYRAEKGQFLGRYQLGNLALKFTGYKNSKGEWTGKNGIKTKDNFKENKNNCQEEAIRLWLSQLEREIKGGGYDKFYGKVIAGEKITQYGLLGAVHLVGTPEVGKFFKSNGTYITKKRFDDYLNGNWKDSNINQSSDSGGKNAG